MNKKTASLFAATCFFASVVLSTAFSQTSQPPKSLQSLVDEAAKSTLQKFTNKKLEENQLSITLLDLRDPRHPVTASFRGNERVYPASVVKLFYLVAAHRLLVNKKIE